MRKLVSVTMVSVMMLTLFFGLYGGVVEEVDGEIVYDSVTNTIYVNDTGRFLFDIDANPNVPSTVFWFTPPDNSYHTTANIQINDSADLTISSTQKLKLYNSTELLYITVRGKLIADGNNPLNTIIIDSDNAMPSPGDWGGMKFVTEEASDSILNFVYIANATDAIYCDRCNLTITNCIVFGNLQRGIYIKDSFPAIKRTQILNNGNGGLGDGGAYFENSELTFENCTVLSSLPNDFILFGTANVTTLNSTFDDDKVLGSGSLYRFTVKWYLDVLVTEEDDVTPIPGTVVYIENRTGVSVEGSPSPTGIDGYVKWVKVTEYTRRGSPTRVPHNPHNITVTHDEYYTGYAEPEPTIESSMQVQVNLTMIRRDLTTDDENITFSTPDVPVAGEDLTIYAKIHNIEVDAAQEVRVIIIDNAPEGGQEIHNSTISEIKGNSYKYAIDVWKPTPGTHVIDVLIDPYDEIKEINSNPLIPAENNNNISITLNVNARPEVNITEPEENAEINATVFIRGTAFDDSRDNVWDPANNITRVDIRLEGYDWIELSSPPNLIPNFLLGNWDWSYEWDTTQWNGTPLDDGNYTITARAWDNYHYSHLHNVNITINNTGANEPPVAIINEPLNNSHFSVNESIRFNGSLSYDPDNDILTYEWDFDDGNFASDNVTYHAFSEKGTYNVRLTVNDSRLQNFTYVAVIIDNSPPYAELTASADTVYVNQTITFYGYNSTDEENPDNLIFFWDYDDTEDTNGDGNFTNDIDNLTMSPIENTTHSYDQPDTYTITLAVWDGRINSTDTVTVTIQANDPPEAVINSPSPLDSFSVNETIVFNASGSSDPNDLDLLYKWEFGDGQETNWLTTPITTYAYKNKASVFTGYTYIVNVTVSDGSAEDTASVNIIVGNYMPVAISKANQTEAQTNNEITFWANDSYDPDTTGDIVNFTWDFGDGEIYTETTSSAPDGSFDGITTHEYADNGVYTVILTVTDNAPTNNPARNSTIIYITITNRPPAIISAIANPQTAKIGETIYFNVTASDEDGTIVKYEWNFGDGYQDFTATLGNTTHSFDTKGEQTVSVRVTDDDGATNTEDVIVNIVNNPPVVSIASPNEDQTVSEIVTIQGTASDVDGSVSIVEIRIDGGVWDSATDTSGDGSWFTWSYDWDTEDGVTNGQHTIYARASDSESDTDPPANVTVTVDNVASSITVTEFLNPSSADAGGAVEVYGDVTYNTGEEVVGADVNITIIDEEGEWVGTTDANGHYSIDITAPEGAGNFWVKVIVTKGSFSGQNQKRLEVIAKPDLAITASDIDFNPSAPFSGETVQITITVRNNGDVNANNFLVNAYDGDPDAGGDPIDSDTVSVSAKSDEDVVLNWDTSGKSGTHFVYIVLDPSDTIDESNEDNNKASRPVTIKGKPDFAIDSADITFSKTDPVKGDTITIRIKIHNNGPEGGMVTYEVYDGDPGIGVEIGSGQESIPANGDETVTVEWTIEDSGDHDIYVVLDPDDEVDEGDEDNNEADKSITVEAAPDEGGIPSWLIPLTVILVVAVFVILLLLYFRERGPKPEKELPVAKVVQKEAKAGAVKVEEEEEEKKTLIESHGGVRI